MEHTTVELTQSGPDGYHFQVTGGKHAPKTVWLLRQPDDPQGQLLLETMEDTFTVAPGQLDFRPYFRIGVNGRSLITAERTLPVKGMNNFRDMGGYETADGRHVKWGCLYRSDHIHNASEEGLAYLKRLGIHTIVDYRGERERKKYPNKEFSPDVQTVVLDPDARAAELAAQSTSVMDSQEDKNLVEEVTRQRDQGLLEDRYGIMMEQYTSFVTKEESKRAFGGMLKIAATPGKAAIVQHCRGGKDRTGFGSMLLLGLLGVSKEDLIADYMITYQNRIVRNQTKMDIYRQYTEDPEVLKHLYSLIETKPEFIEASYDMILSTYGSLSEYATQELGLSEHDILQLKELYLQ